VAWLPAAEEAHLVPCVVFSCLWVEFVYILDEASKPDSCEWRKQQSHIKFDTVRRRTIIFDLTSRILNVFTSKIPVAQRAQASVD
jgi:hypothetical protein